MARGGASVAPATGKSFSFIFFFVLNQRRGEEEEEEERKAAIKTFFFFTHLSGKQTGQFSFRFGRRKRLIFFSPRHATTVAFLDEKKYFRNFSEVPPGGLVGIERVRRDQVNVPSRILGPQNSKWKTANDIQIQ